MSRPVFQVLSRDSDNTLSTIELDHESRKYIHVSIINIHESWSIDGEMTVENTEH